MSFGMGTSFNSPTTLTGGVSTSTTTAPISTSSTGFGGGAVYPTYYPTPTYTAPTYSAPTLSTSVASFTEPTYYPYTAPIPVGTAVHQAALQQSAPTYVPQPVQPAYIPPPAPVQQQQPLQGGVTQQQDWGPLMLPGDIVIEQAPTQIALMLSNIIKQGGGDPTSYKPYMDLLTRYPEATAQITPDQNPFERHQYSETASDATPLGRGEDRQLIAQQPQMDRVDPRPEPGYAPPGATNQPFDGSNMGQYQQQYPQGYPQQPMQPQQGYGQYPQQQMDPRVQAMQNALPYNNPRMAQAQQRQQAIQNYMAQEMSQPMAPPNYAPPPGSQRGWGGFVQRGAMLNPQNRNTMTRQQEEYNKLVWHQQQQEMQRRQAMLGNMATMSDAELSQEGQMARQVFAEVSHFVRDSLKDRQPTPNQLAEMGYKIANAYPPGPAREAAIAAAGQMGMDLRAYSGVPVSQIEQERSQGRQDRHAKAEDDNAYRDKMNTIRIKAGELRNTRMAKTNDAYIRQMDARADKAEIDAQLAETYGDETKKLALMAKRAQIEGIEFKEKNSALSKANTINSQYEQSLTKLYMSGPKDRPAIQKDIEARFGKPDPETGLPADVKSARAISHELTAEMKEMADRQRMVPPPAPVAPQPNQLGPKTAWSTASQQDFSKVTGNGVMKLDGTNPQHAELAKMILQTVGGDKEKARAQAKKMGYEF